MKVLYINIQFEPPLVTLPPQKMIVLMLMVALATSSEQVFLSAMQAHPCYATDGPPEKCLLVEQKRAQEALDNLEAVSPCSCETLPRLLDLGREYFPRYLPSVDCTGGTCWPGPYRCQPRYYEVKVLKLRDKADKISRRQDFSLPESLREIWKFILVKVIVACECGL